MDKIKNTKSIKDLKIVTDIDFLLRNRNIHFVFLQIIGE